MGPFQTQFAHKLRSARFGAGGEVDASPNSYEAGLDTGSLQFFSQEFLLWESHSD
jgi:hypothetical protein